LLARRAQGCEGQGEEVDYIIIIMEREEGILEYSYEMKVEIAKEKLSKMRVLIVGARGVTNSLLFSWAHKSQRIS
jgi:hypothetical protein